MILSYRGSITYAIDLSLQRLDLLQGKTSVFHDKIDSNPILQHLTCRLKSIGLYALLNTLLHTFLHALLIAIFEVGVGDVFFVVIR